jgi:CRISPR/Cas system type I-B associated protein Csh2 (Cas7 group RAMP superfamily)
MNIHPTKKKPRLVSESQELKEKIRKRAYQLYEERLWEDGHEVEDWLRAEEEILEQEVRPKAA